jgi:hypothetical protein
MRSTQAPEPTGVPPVRSQTAPAAIVPSRAEAASGIMRLQRLAGNRAVVPLLAARSSPRAPALQRDDLKDTLTQAADTHTGGDVAWLEQILTDPGNTALTLNQESPESLLESLQARNCDSETVDSIKSMTFEQLLRILLQYGVITQSCGQTAALVHGLVSPSTVDQPSTEKSVDGLIETIETSAVEAVQGTRPWYVRVEGGGHAFVIEVTGGPCRLYQSFFGATTLASDLRRDRSFSRSELVQRLRLALTPSNKGDIVAVNIATARRELFGSQAVHPDGKFQVHSFPQEDGMGQRLADKYHTGAQAWATELSRPATGVMAQAQTQTAQPQAGTIVSVPLGAVSDGDTYAPVTAEELENEKSALEASQGTRPRKDYSVQWEGFNLGGFYRGRSGEQFQFEVA